MSKINLTFNERKIIEKMLDQAAGVRAIGRILVSNSQRAGKFELTQFAVVRFWRVRLV